MAAPIWKADAEGLSVVPGSRVAAPMPMPIMERITCVTRPTAVPASTAPHETLLIMMVRMSSAGVTGLTCAALLSPRLRGVSGFTVPGWAVAMENLL
jgi:hypothetical protein